MAWDLATARTKIGLAPGDTSRDVDLSMSMAVALDLLETYLDRGILYQNMVETAVEMHGRRVSLYRYPLVAVDAVTTSGASDQSAGAPIGTNQYLTDDQTGMVIFKTPTIVDKVTVVYKGGYVTLPPVLEWVLWTTWSTLWAEMFPGAPAGGGGGGGGTIVQGSGDLKSVTIFGVGKLDYDVGATAIGGGSSTTPSTPSAADQAKMIVDPTSRLAMVLGTYRRKFV